MNTVMPLAQGSREPTEDRAATARERRRLAAEIDSRFAPVLDDLVGRLRDGDDEAAVHAALTAHAVELRRWVERLARGRRAAAAAEVAGERLRLARRLHDTTLQLVEYVVTDAYGAGLDRAAVARHLADALAELRAAAAPAVAGGELRRGVEQAIADARRLGLDMIVLEGDALDARLAGSDLELVVGTIREALTNVRKHARARRAVVRVERSGGALRVTVEDDGVGTDRRALRRAEGLGLRESIFGRAGGRAARVRIHTAPGAGTRITLTMPQEAHQP